MVSAQNAYWNLNITYTKFLITNVRENLLIFDFNKNCAQFILTFSLELSINCSQFLYKSKLNKPPLTQII